MDHTGRVDHRERVEAALAGGRPDRVPVSAWRHDYRTEWSVEGLAEATVERARRFDWDFVKFQPRASVFAEAFGNVYRPSRHPFKSGPLESAVLNDLGDWERIELRNRQVLADQVRSLSLAARALGDRVPVIQTVFSPISVASYLAGKDKRRVVRDLRAHPGLVLPVLRRIGDVLIEFAEESVAAGAAGVFYAISGYATPAAMPVAVYEELLLPLDRELCSRLPAAGWFNVLHVCGSRVNLAVAREIPVPVVSWSVHNQGNPSLAEGRALTGRVVMGGVGQRGSLLHGPPAAVAAEARAAAAVNGGRGVLVAPGCSVPPRVRDANLAAMTEAA